MLKGEVAPVAELVQARGWGREENLKLTVSPCVHSITPLPPVSFETHEAAVTSHLCYPQPSTIPAQGSPCTRIPGHLTAPHPHSQASEHLQWVKVQKKGSY